MRNADFTAHNHGTIWLLKPNTEPSRAWAEVSLKDRAGWGHFYAIEHRHVSDVVIAL